MQYWEGAEQVWCLRNKSISEPTKNGERCPAMPTCLAAVHSDSPRFLESVNELRVFLCVYYVVLEGEMELDCIGATLIYVFVEVLDCDV